MTVTDRVHKFAEILHAARGAVSMREFRCELRCSEATFHRVRREYEARHGGTVIHDRRYGGYRLEKDGKIEVPGLRLHPEEIAGLLGLEQWLESLGAGVLNRKLGSIRAELERRLKQHGFAPEDWTRRVRLLPMHLRPVDPNLLLETADATLNRKRLRFEYRGARERAHRLREVSPQRIVHYRDTWYLDALDHGHGKLRCFAVHRMRDLRALRGAAEDIPHSTLDAHFAGPYGIFGGPSTAMAVLLFEGEAARIVNEERWHPQENRQTLPGGKLRLEFPCGDVRELTRDVLRFADEVTVEGPPELREAVAGVIGKAMGRNKQGGAPRSRGRRVKGTTVPVA